jgi:hypothetical protein
MPTGTEHLFEGGCEMDERKASAVVSRTLADLGRLYCGWLLNDGSRCEYETVSDAGGRCYYHAKVRDHLL